MVFLDTCIWIELCGVKSPITPNEIRQAEAASTLLQQLLQDEEVIVSCNEQLLEIISAIQKIKLKEYNRTARSNGRRGCGDIKEFRSNHEDFLVTKSLCKSIIDDVKHFARIDQCNYNVDDVLDKMDLADLNDCIYFDYCKQNDIHLYTFDSDICNIESLSIVHIL